MGGSFVVVCGRRQQFGALRTSCLNRPCSFPHTYAYYIHITLLRGILSFGLFICFHIACAEGADFEVNWDLMIPMAPQTSLLPRSSHHAVKAPWSSQGNSSSVLRLRGGKSIGAPDP